MDHQHCIEIKTLKRDLARCNKQKDGRIRVVFKSASGSSKAAFLITREQAIEICEFMYSDMKGEVWRGEGSTCNSQS